MFHLLLIGIVGLSCLLSYRLTSNLPLPSLLIFIFLGMLFGQDGPGGIYFDDVYLTEEVCSCALLFIMYFGGFNTNLKAAKNVCVQSILMASLGVVITGATTAFCSYTFLHTTPVESAIIGSVLASTDAASVFSILRSQNLSLKHNCDSLLEIESGSNDPMSFLLTYTFCTLAAGKDCNVAVMLIQSVVIGLIWGYVLARISILILQNTSLALDQGEIIFLLALGLIIYAGSNIFGGNGYLSVYVAGLLLGNSNIPHKSAYARFFSVVTSMAQMLIFFILGLLVTPTDLPQVALPAFIIFLCITFISRPVAVVTTLAYTKPSREKIALISWAGFRGAASIVFAIMVLKSHIPMTYNLYNLVFLVVLFSLLIQGATLSKLASRLNMIDENTNVLTTFNDYIADQDYVFVEVVLDENHSLCYKRLSEVDLDQKMLVALILREGKPLLPDGQTKLLPYDKLVIIAPQFSDEADLPLHEIVITNSNPYCNKTLSKLSHDKNTLVIAIKRDGNTFIPNGSTKLLENDLVILAQQKAIR